MMLLYARSIIESWRSGDVKATSNPNSGVHQIHTGNYLSRGSCVRLSKYDIRILELVFT
jgi:hypothetical protein